jgi:DNA-binding XRE family transcriptional regulator
MSIGCKTDYGARKGRRLPPGRPSGLSPRDWDAASAPAGCLRLRPPAARRLARRQRLSGLTQARFAARFLGVSRQTYAALAACRPVSLPTALAAAALLS